LPLGTFRLINSSKYVKYHQTASQDHLHDRIHDIPQGYVLGVDNLRVSDRSAVPNINAGNTTTPAMMLGDRCADFIFGLD
jgi:choline dehydrogenase-like flavoprotein